MADVSPSDPVDEAVHRLREADLVWRVADGEVIVLDLRSSIYITLNRSARVLWEALVEGVTTDALVELLRGRYGIGPEQALADANAFLDDLRARGLLQ